MSELVVLDETAVTRLKRAINSDIDLLVWIGDWLAHLGLFSDAQIYDILKYIKPEIERFDFEASKDIDRRAVTLAVCDSRFISFTGIPVFLDIKTGDYVEGLDDFAVTHIMCDITALRRRMLYRQEMFNARNPESGSEDSSTPD